LGLVLEGYFGLFGEQGSISNFGWRV